MSQEFPLEFPCDFPIKALGQSSEDFPDVVTEIVRHHAPDLDESMVRIKESRHSRYQSVTVTVRATSRGQLDAIYRELTAHERVMMAL